MERRLKILFVIMLTAFCASAQSLQLQVAQQVIEGRKFTLVLKMRDFKGQAPENLDLPNCTRLYGPAYSSGFEMNSINGHTEQFSYVGAQYTFRADKASTIIIPAITITSTDGKKYSTKPTKLTIIAPGQRPQYTRPYDIDDIPDGGRVDTKDHFSADDMFVRINVDRNSVYEQEPIVATIKLYTRMDIGSFQMLTQPEFEGFLSEELDVKDGRGNETVNGKDYVTLILKRCILYPQKSGKLKLTSGTYQVTLQDRVMVNSGSFIPDFRIVEKQIKTPESVASVNVNALPTPQPASFDGAVGNYTAKVDLSTTNMHTNEPATYTYTVSGTGNIKYLKTPVLDMPPGIEVYTPKTDIDAHYTGGNLSGTFTVTYTLVPQEVGTFEIPAREMTYFNPSSREYKTINLQGYTVRVGKGLTSGETEQQSIARGMTDILHIKTSHATPVKEITYTYRIGWYWALYVALAAIFATIIIIYRRQLRLNADVRGRQLARALRKAMKRFKTARAAMAAHDSEAFYADINRALWGYLSDKLGIPASQLLRDNIATQLSEYGVSTEGTDDVIAILDQCEMARFTPMGSDADMAELYDKVVKAVKSIENVKK